MLDREVVERLGELLAKATPGPWEADIGCYTDSGSRYNAIMAHNPWTEVCGECGPGEADAALIAAAVNALPELLRVYRLWMDGERSDCGECNGDGVWNGETCDDCGGSGYFRLVRDGDSGEG